MLLLAVALSAIVIAACGASKSSSSSTPAADDDSTPTDDDASPDDDDDASPTDDDASPADDDTADGTWTDPATGHMWQVNPSTAPVDWAGAGDYCKGLTLGGHADWRLPDIDELRSIVRGCAATQTGGSCGVIDTCLGLYCDTKTCNGCGSGGPASGCYWPSELGGTCTSWWYWSSSPVSGAGVQGAWCVNFGSADVVYDDFTFDDIVRCVRS